jgi:predicted O-methyltransferase YrrM
MSGSLANHRTTRGDWADEGRLVVDGVEFHVTHDADLYMTEVSTAERFVVAKQVEMVELLCDVVEALQPRHVVELGIFKGGSAALLALLARPEKLTAIELETESVEPLEELIAARDLRDVVSCHYGIDQGDRVRLDELVRADHGDASLDLVVDDASHFLAETRSSFEVLFPRLRPGGVYMIEDWAWAHYPDHVWQHAGGIWSERPALTNLLVELTLVAGSRSGLVADVRVTEDIALITRGPAKVEAPMRLEEHYLNRGLPFRPLL